MSGNRPTGFFKSLRVLLVVFALGAVGFAFGYKYATTGHRLFFDTAFSSSNASLNIGPDSSVNLSQFWQVLSLLKGEYYDQTKIVPSNLVYGAIKGMVSALGDPYTIFLDKSQQTVTSQDLSGSFSGVGIELGYKGVQLAVVSPLSGSPAEKAGVLPGDLIIAIKDTAKNIDKSTEGMSLPDAVSIIRGPKGTKVTLGLLRSGSQTPVVVDLVRDDISVPSVVLQYVGQNKKVAHIKILKFGAETKNEWDKAILDVLGKSGISGVIVDVRNNPGGYLQAAVEIATDFLDKGTTVVSEESGGKTIDTLKTEANGRLRKTHLVVLINGGSASASEIFAGAMRDNLNIKLVGDKSFGKGTVQEPREFPDGTGIHITIAKWLTPKGTWVHGKGLDPDISVKNDATTEVDEQLNSAIKLFE